jgi:hypothetical protein
MRHAENEAVQAMCAEKLLDRGWGKAPQAITGENGEGDIRVIVRHIVRGTIIDEQPKQIEAVPIGTDGESR